MRLLICGDRNWTNKELIRKYIFSLKPDVIIEGCARGADSIAGKLAREYNIELEEYPANWKKYHIIAGPIRNKQMLVEGKPDFILAFHNDIKNSKGTKNMVAQSKKAGIKGKVISEK